MEAFIPLATERVANDGAVIGICEKPVPVAGTAQRILIPQAASK
jgi:hypothetical protein